MTHLIPRRACSGQRGVAAIEFLIILLVLLPAMTIPIFFGRYFWHYTVVQKAAHDAARYLSTVPVREMRSRELARAAEDVAYGIAEEELADLNPGRGLPSVEVFCGVPDVKCIGLGADPLPRTVMVRVQANMADTLFGVVPTGPSGLRIKAEAEVRYVGH